MKYNFDKAINRINTNSAKWDTRGGELLPMWVADMDFEAPKPVIEALKERVDHGIYGYSFAGDTYYNSIINWMERKHGWNIEKNSICFSPGVVPAINMLIKAFMEVGDKIIVQTPVYYPFFRSVKNNGCSVLENPLIYEKGEYKMDFEDLKERVKDPKAKAILLCNPHNPVGRVWSREELVKLGTLCIENNVIIISDEIHSDLIYKGYKHIPFASISKKFAENSVVCTAPSKTFNLAGLQTSNIIISNVSFRKLFKNVLRSNGLSEPNLFGIIATEAAYNYGEEWLEELLTYLEGNLNFLINYIQKNMPKIKVIKPQGTYLVWLDCTELNMGGKELHEFFLKEAKVWLDQGYIFGDNADGFERINIACPRLLLEEGLSRMNRALNKVFIC